MRASGWREFFEGALPESRVVTPATRHTPTRSLGGAETGRSAMNGNDGPFACAACKLVFEHQNAAAHSCKQCKLPVHSRGWCAIWCGCQKKASTSVASPASRRSQRRAQRGRPAAPPAGRLACGAPGPGWRLMSARPHRPHRHTCKPCLAQSADAAFSTCSERTWCGART